MFIFLLQKQYKSYKIIVTHKSEGINCAFLSVNNVSSRLRLHKVELLEDNACAGKRRKMQFVLVYFTVPLFKCSVWKMNKNH
jgi:hypothetical protein